MNKYKISVIIPTKDRVNILQQSLYALIKAINNLSIEVIVINDSLSENLKEKLLHFKNITVVNNTKSGVASARNYGASLANGEWLLFLDDDMIITENCLETYINYMSTQDKISVNINWEYSNNSIQQIQKHAFGRFLIKYGFTTLSGWNNIYSYPQNQKIIAEGITSQNLFIKSSHFKNVGGYNELFPMAGFEDYALTSTLKSNNFVMYIDTHSKMIHNELDRLTPDMWFERKKRGAITRKVAVNIGYKELTIKYTLVKHIFYYLYTPTKLFVNLVLLFSTKSKNLDLLSFSLYKFLLGLSIYKGYNSSLVKNNA